MDILKKIKSFLQVNEDKNKPISRVAGLREILSEIDHLPEGKARYLSLYALILNRVAYADQDVSEEESKKIEEILTQWGKLSEEQAVVVSSIAKNQNIIFGGVDNFIATKEFSELSSREQKIELLNSLFAVAASDNSISNDESNTIRVISKELGLSHPEYIEARKKFSDKLEALK